MGSRVPDAVPPLLPVSGSFKILGGDLEQGPPAFEPEQIPIDGAGVDHGDQGGYGVLELSPPGCPEAGELDTQELVLKGLENKLAGRFVVSMAEGLQQQDLVIEVPGLLEALDEGRDRVAVFEGTNNLESPFVVRLRWKEGGRRWNENNAPGVVQLAHAVDELRERFFVFRLDKGLERLGIFPGPR